MTSTFLTISAAVCFSLAAMARAAENYSLWPRRPVELEQARRLVRENKPIEVVELLAPFVGEQGIAGREARQITGAVNVRRYLSRRHPAVQVLTVKRGETLASIASANHCPVDVIMLLNGIVQPSSLKIGQKLVIVPMTLRIEIHPAQREVSVWDGSSLVADYDLIAVEGDRGTGNEETKVASRDAYLNGMKVSARSPLYAASDRSLSLENGHALVSDQRGEGVRYRMQRKDLNELALLVAAGARVSIVRDASAFFPPAEEGQESAS